MNICVCGWYGREFDEFYMTLYKANKRHPVTVVAKRDDNFWDEMGLPYAIIKNIGLEWAAYNHFLQHIWQGGDTLFTHDDVLLRPIIINNETVNPETLFDKLAEIEYDQAYLFSGRAEDVFNIGHHGRALFISAGLMEWLRPAGIWFDSQNQGYTGGKKPPGTVQHYNEGTRRFNEYMQTAKKNGFNTLNKVYVPAYAMAHRGTIKNREELL